MPPIRLSEYQQIVILNAAKPSPRELRESFHQCVAASLAGCSAIGGLVARIYKEQKAAADVGRVEKRSKYR